MSNKLKELIDLYKSKKFVQAEKKCSDLLKKIKPNHEILNLYAVILFELEKYDQSILQLNKSLEIKPDYIQAYNSLGNVYFKKNDFEKAILNFDKAIELKPDYFEAIANKANVYYKKKNYEEALKNYNFSLSINKSFQPAYEGVARISKILEKYDDAIFAWQNILKVNPQNVSAHVQLGDIFFDKNILDKAANHYGKALSINPEKEFLFSSYLLTKTKMCDWEDLDKNLEKLRLNILKDKKVSTPYSNLIFFDDPLIHLKASKIWADEHLDEKKIGKIKIEKFKEKKIKIGYFSADFRTHAMGHLMVRMMELHNKDDFEIYGFYFGPKIKSDDEISKRIIKCFDKFVDISLFNEIETAKISREIGIDIAVDLMCYTGNYNKFGIFTKRCAPLQVNFLGYPGTSGSNFIDYIIVDGKIVDDVNKEYFSEKLLVLPDAYQPNEEEKKVSQKTISKSDYGLPEDKFVFACFNSHQKILPKTFDSWCKILHNKSDSVLWLLKDNDYSEKNLKREAEIRDINPERIVFAKHVNLEEHLARLKFVDLFLDTFPYNAHTTCSDALRSGIPVLTIEGKSFASRVAASLLSVMNLDELIVKTNEEFEKKAIDISNNLDELKILKEKVINNKLNSNLFKTDIFTNNLEKSYKAIYENYIEGKEPRDFKL